MTSGAPTETSAPTPQRIGVPREIFPGEKRVASVPEAVVKLIKLGFEVVVERGAGELANLSDDDYRGAGASIAPTAAELWSGSDIVFKVRAAHGRRGVADARGSDAGRLSYGRRKTRS